MIDLNLKYSYELILSLANEEVEMKQIKDEIERSVITYNQKSRNSKNIKQIETWDIKNNLLLIRLNTNIPLTRQPSKALFLFTQCVMTYLRENEEKKYLLDEIIRRKTFFKSVGNAKEISKNQADTRLNPQLNAVEVFNLITEIFLDDKINSDKKDKVKAEILKLLEEYKIYK